MFAGLPLTPRGGRSVLALNHRFQWWTRKGSTDPVRVKKDRKNTNPRLPKPFVNLSYDKDSKQFFGPKNSL